MAKGKKTGGRQPGSPNKVTRELKDMVLMALSKAGGVTYLTKQATETPQAFLSLLGRVLPMQVTGANGKPLIPPGGIVFRIEQQPGTDNRT